LEAENNSRDGGGGGGSFDNRMVVHEVRILA
jgi:hypothetical protein